MIHEFKLSTIANIDGGRVEEALNQAIKRVIADLEDRPGVTEARKVNMQIEFSPVTDEDGMVETAKVAFQIKDSIPTRKSKFVDMQIRKGQRLAFNDLSEDNIDQRTLDEGNSAFE